VTLVGWLIVARWLHVGAVSLLFGTALFPFYGIDKAAAASAATLRRLPRLLLWSAVLALVSGVFWFALAAIDADAQGAMAFVQSRFGWIWLLRLSLAAVLIYVSAGTGKKQPNVPASIGSAVLLVSLVGLGHDGTTGNAAAAVHIVADVIHLVASGVWIGALFMLTLMGIALMRRRVESDVPVFHDALMRFSGVGPGMVIALVLSGIANSGLVGPGNALQSFTSVYSQVLVAKIGLFLLMLMLAAANRYWLTPKLRSALISGDRMQAAIVALNASIVAESVLAVLVLAAVGWLGTLPPP